MRESQHDLMTPAEVSARLRMAEKTLTNQRSRGEGPPFVRLGRTIRYSRNALDSWLNAQQVGGGAA